MPKLFAVFIPIFSIIITTIFIVSTNNNNKKMDKKIIYILLGVGLVLLLSLYFLIS